MRRTMSTRNGGAAINPAPENSLLDDSQAAAFLQIKPRTLRLWRHTRGLPHLKLTTRIIRYRRSDLDGWLARHFVAIRG